MLHKGRQGSSTKDIPIGQKEPVYGFALLNERLVSLLTGYRKARVRLRIDIDKADALLKNSTDKVRERYGERCLADATLHVDDGYNLRHVLPPHCPLYCRAVLFGKSVHHEGIYRLGRGILSRGIYEDRIGIN